MKSFSRVCVAMLLALSLVACPRLAKPPATASAKPTTLPRPEVPGATLYGIDPLASELHILVYRGGAMAYLGHNHVISSGNLHGWIWLHPTLERSGFAIELPVASLIVDDPDSRRSEGTDFAAAVPDDARQGTYGNLQRPEVLEGARYPSVTLKSSRVTGILEHPVVTAGITLKGVLREVQVPTQLTLAGDALTVSGEFALKQSDFGIQPFSVALGALRVEDEIKIKFKLQARKASDHL